MNADQDSIVVHSGVCRQCNSVHSTQVYHRDYPEVWAEGETAEAAAARLVDRLRLALDASTDRWRGEPVRAAIADAQAFIARGDSPALTPRGR